MIESSARKANHAIGALFLAIFGGVWLLGWCFNATGTQRLGLLAIGLGAAGLVATAVLRLRQNLASYQVHVRSPDGRRQSRGLGAVNAVQWAAIIALVILLPDAQARWFVPSVIAIIGLHFIPLAFVLNYRPYLGTALALVALAGGYPWLAPAGAADPIGMLGAGLILWATAAAQLVAARP